MKKLMTLCFAILFSVLAVLSCINFSYDGLEKVEADKQSIKIEKRSDVTNEQFLNDVDAALKIVNSDIMYRFVDVSSEKVHYHYFKTANTNDFLSMGGQYDNIPLSDLECLSTINQDGYTVYNLKVSSMFQDISFYNWNKAAVYDLSSCTYFVDKGNSSKIAGVIADLGYEVTLQSEVHISGKMSIILFAFIPICLMIMSMAFYVLSNGKKNVLRKMEGYLSRNILVDELRSNWKSFLLVFSIIELLNISFAIFAFGDAVFQYIIFAAHYLLIGVITFAVGVIVALVLIFVQSGSEQIKGKVPKKGIYYLTMLTKCVFVIFIVFFMSIAIRNVYIAHNTYETAHFLADKVNDYVTIPIFETNASSRGLEENYLAFYNATVDEYDGVLVDTGNYMLNVSTGKTLSELFGQEEIVVNSNYLLLNPIYNPNGNTILPDSFADGEMNILLPESKTDRMDKYRGYAMTGYSKETNFIMYDDENTEVYSYNADIGSGSYGRLDSPIIVVVEAEDLDGIFILSYCSQGSYFINPRTDNPYSILLPLLKETGIDAVTPQTPFILSNFDDVLNQQFQMLLLYGTQTLILSIGLVCLILFFAKLYCENYSDRIACCLIEGYSLLSCIRQHIVVIIISSLLSVLAIAFAGRVMQVSMNYYIVIGALIIESVSAIIISKRYTKANLCEIVKGAE